MWEERFNFFFLDAHVHSALAHSTDGKRMTWIGSEIMLEEQQVSTCGVSKPAAFEPSITYESVSGPVYF